MSLLSTNSFVVFVSSVVPNYILGYAAVIAFTALFFLFCGYFLNSHDMPSYWKWMNYISTMSYSYEGLLMNQFQTLCWHGLFYTESCFILFSDSFRRTRGHELPQREAVRGGFKILRLSLLFCNNWCDLNIFFEILNNINIVSS